MKPRAGDWVKVRSKEEILRTLYKKCGTNPILQSVVRKGLAGHFAPDPFGETRPSQRHYAPRRSALARSSAEQDISCRRNGCCHR
jgi:hypothetical protein